MAIIWKKIAFYIDFVAERPENSIFKKSCVYTTFMGNRYLPIGIQDFEDLRRRGFIYVDKTAFIGKVVREGKPYFLSRTTEIDR